MRRLFLIFSNLLFISFYCFAQQNLPGKIIGKIPDKNSAAAYQIQVGAYTIEENAEEAIFRLAKNALIPSTEQYLDFTRVMIKGIPANQVANFLVILKESGFNEVIIREDTASSTTERMGTDRTGTERTGTERTGAERAGTNRTGTERTDKITEKWDINTPNSAYAWFEFNRDMYYIAAENNANKTVHFGKYTMPDKDTINMENRGVAKITRNNNAEVRFTFSPIDEPSKEINLAAVKAQTIPVSPKEELFCRTWKVINCTERENIGSLLIISNTGTYYFTTPDEKSNKLSSWRWYDDTNEEFEYSHDNWNHYGKIKINNLTRSSLRISDPGHFNIIDEYSKAGKDIQWELVPAE